MLLLRIICMKDRCAYFVLGSLITDYVKVIWLAYIASESVGSIFDTSLIFEPARAWSLNHDVQTRDLLSGAAGTPILFWARLTNQYGMRGSYIFHIGPGRELSATCEDHLWAHGGSRYFVRKPPLDSSSRYLIELVGMLGPCLYRTWTTAFRLTPYPSIAVFTWHLVMNVLIALHDLYCLFVGYALSC